MHQSTVWTLALCVCFWRYAIACTSDLDCNHGECIQLDFDDLDHGMEGNTNYCQCEEGYIGPDCDVHCPEKCHNGGTCRPIDVGFGKVISYECECPPNFKGESCSIPYVECADGTQCLNGSTCRPSDTSSYECDCPFSHQGFFCEHPVSLVTCPDGHQCANGGTCDLEDDGETYTCQCEPGFVGSYCHRIQEEPTKSGQEAAIPFSIATVLGLLLAFTWFRVCRASKRKKASSSEASSSDGVMKTDDEAANCDNALEEREVI